MKGTTLKDRYQLQDLLGSGGSGQTYRALDLQTNQPVAIKLMSLKRAPNWKAIELFEREAKTLAQLDHPAIPKYLDFFRILIADEETFGIVQQIAPGQSLSAWMAAGRTFTEKDLRQMIRQMLEILIYLQSFAPPLIHRDIKPQNILMTDSGIIYLVDFGAVRDQYHLTITGGSTLVGTYGYMAPEQFRGQAVLATDLYGLGATIVYLLTGIDPADLPQKNLKLQFRDRLHTNERLADWLDRVLQPIPEDRFANAKQALHGLEQNQNGVVIAPRPQEPVTSLVADGESLRITIPPIWMASRTSRQTFAIILSLSILVGLLFWIVTAATFHTGIVVLISIALITITPWLLYWIVYYLVGITTHQEVTIIAEQLVSKVRLGSMVIMESTLAVKNIQRILTKPTKIQALDKGIRLSHNFMPDVDGNYPNELAVAIGSFLDYPEQCWLAREIEDHLRSCQEQ